MPLRRLGVAFLVCAAGSAGAATAALAADPLVRISDAQLDRTPTGAVVTATVRWNDDGVETYDMFRGDVRLVAATGRQGRVVLERAADTANVRPDAAREQRVRIELSARDRDAIDDADDRVTLTATQHPTVTPRGLTRRSYVTVAQLRDGPSRGRVGSRSCADEPILPNAELAACDLVGATLTGAAVSTSVPGARLQYADLSGADLQRSDLSVAQLDFGRVNGADASGATIRELNLRRGLGIGFVARGRATLIDDSDIYDSTLDDADFSGARFRDTSLGLSRFDGHASFRGTMHEATVMAAGSYRGADLSEAQFDGALFTFADLTKATLDGSVVNALLDFAIVCDTTLPDGTVSRRDCPGRPVPPVTPLVRVDGRLVRSPDRALVGARIDWDDRGADAYGMTVGDVRVVAVDAASGRATLLAVRQFSVPAGRSSSVQLAIADRDKLRTIGPHDRVVVTATQHPPAPAAGNRHTTRSYVTVKELQAGPARGRAGARDCSDQPIAADRAEPGSLVGCDLVGAQLARADLSGTLLYDTDLSGAVLRGSDLDGSGLDGSRAADVDATGASVAEATLRSVVAPGWTMRDTQIVSGEWLAADLDDADLTGSHLSSTHLNGVSLVKARLDRTQLTHVELAFGDLTGARVTGATIEATSFAFADLTRATLEGSRLGDDEQGLDPLRDAFLCDTTLPGGAKDSRDCRSG
jgi:uncharacterized protein YjbI with pentapeptide repeats